ncbi:MAG TPA: 16S rRNA (cytosine(1402)-N(4))-methyltransferase RsmH [Chlamydiales bacterium]|nr:16S rRNA (cytosine(1402)-N(4))-methyltransferase RsmH [Chlamydiales bacterium]
MSHRPVLLHEVVKSFEGVCCTLFFDGTIGAGGHAKALLEAHPEVERYLACDRDVDALRLAQKELAPWSKKIEWIHGPYGELRAHLEERKIKGIDGFLIDIGVSSMQLDVGERGFSFLKEAPLDMRMDRESEVTAEEIVNKTREEELARILFEYGEERRSRKIAKAIVEARRKRKIKTTLELAKIVEQAVGGRGRIHPATLTFQALRIAVNDELGQLEKGLKEAIHFLNPGGRIAVITFHSLEDRIVKQIFREESQVERMTKKPIVPSLQEMKENRRARSAKLRVVEKKR